MTKEFEKTIAPWLGRTVKMIELKIEDTLKADGIDITKVQFLLLKTVEQKEGINQNDLAFLTNRNKSSLARIINSLEKKNFIARLPSKKDKRVNHLFITSHGKQMIQIAQPYFIEMGNTIEKGLSKTEIENMINTLKKIQTNVGIEVPTHMLKS